MPAPKQPFQPGGASLDQVVARLLFLRTVQNLAPHVVNELAKEARSAFVELERVYAATVESAVLTELARVLPEANRLQTKLAGWGERYHLTGAPWIIDAALKYLKHYDPASPSALPFASSGAVGYWVPSPEIQNFPAYRPDVESASEFWARTQSHVQQQEQSYRRGGLKPAPYRPNLEKHIEWLVRFQVLEVRYEELEIGKDAKDPSEVRKYTKAVAELLPLKRCIEKRRKAEEKTLSLEEDPAVILYRREKERKGQPLKK